MTITNWTDVGTPTTTEQSATQAHSGTYSGHVICDADNEGIKQAQTVTSGSWYRIDGWIYLESGSADISLGGTVIDSISTTGAWTKLTGLKKATASSHDLEILSDGGSAEFYADDVSCRLVRDATGIDISGRDTFTIPTSGHLDDTQGTVRFWFNPRWDAGDSTERFFFDTDADSCQLSITSGNKLRFYPNITDSSGRYQESTSALTSVNWAKDEYRCIHATYDNTADEIKLYIDGVENTTTATGTGWTVPVFGTNMYIGSKNDNTTQADATFDAFRTYDTVFTAGDALADYQAGSEYIDSETTSNYADVSNADVRLTAILNLDTAGKFGFTLRRQDADNQYVVVYDENKDKVEVYQDIAGTRYFAGEVAYTLNASTNYKVDIRTSAGDIDIYSSGASVLNLTDADLTAATIFGIETQEPDTASTIDNFLLESN